MREKLSRYIYISILICLFSFSYFFQMNRLLKQDLQKEKERTELLNQKTASIRDEISAKKEELEQLSLDIRADELSLWQRHLEQLKEEVQ